jgi:hypothetical protein
MERQKNIKEWISRLGWVGFFIFLGKGLVWIAVWYGAAEWFKSCN